MAEPLIWLPLNGDLRNNGLNGVTVDVATATTFTTNGKIGKALSGGKIRIPASYVSQIFNNDAVTVAFWYNNNGSTSNHAICGFQGNSEGDSGAVRSYDFFNYPTVNDFHYSMGTLGGGSLTGIIPNNTWVHFCISWNGSNLKIYVNGELQITRTGSSNFTFDKSYYISFGHSQMLNDFRIYDTALSDYEIKLLSQGLVLHYPLDRNGLGGENLLSKASSSNANRDFGSSSELTEVTFAGWDTYCNTHLTDHGWNNLIGKPIIYRVWIDNPQDGQATSGMLHFRYSAGGTSYKQIRGTIIQPGESGWSITSTTVPTPPDGQTISYVEASLRHSSGTTPSATVNYQYAKVEMGDTPSPWSPSDADLGSTDTTVYDTSGFGNNGTATNVTYDGDTARYTASSVFDDSTAHIAPTSVFQNGQTITELTVCEWFNTTTLNGTTPNLWSLGENAFHRLRIASATSIWSYSKVGTGMKGTTYSCKSLTDGNWHQAVFTFKDGIITVYIDGDQIGTSDFSSDGTQLMCSSTAWHLGGYTTTAEKFIGKLSDFRLYATALSAEDIKDLFDASAKVNRDGTMYAYSYVEF